MESFKAFETEVITSWSNALALVVASDKDKLNSVVTTLSAARLMLTFSALEVVSIFMVVMTGGATVVDGGKVGADVNAMATSSTVWASVPEVEVLETGSGFMVIASNSYSTVVVAIVLVVLLVVASGISLVSSCSCVVLA